MSYGEGCINCDEGVLVPESDAAEVFHQKILSMLLGEIEETSAAASRTRRWNDGSLHRSLIHIKGGSSQG